MVKIEKKYLRFFGIFFLVISILILNFVLASLGQVTDVYFSQNVTSDYDEGNFTINWTAETGAYFYFIYPAVLNTTGDYILFENATNDSATGYSFNNWTEGNYTFVISAWNTTEYGANSTNVTIYVDRTAPVITLPFYTNATPKQNTTTLTLNISVTDAKSGLTGTLCLIDVNGTNQTISYSAGWCNTTNGNLTGLADGNHTIEVYVNDTVNNLGLNNSFVVLADTTVPSVTIVSCSPSSVIVGDIVTCGCSGNDSGSGINSSLTTPSSTPSTSQTGTFTYACSVTDNAGNSATTTASYSVTGDSGDGSTTSSSWTSTHGISDEIFEKGYTQEIGAKKRVRVRVENTYHYIGVVSLTETKATINITSAPVQVILGIGEDAKVDVTDDGFYDIYVILNAIANNKANVTMQKIHEEIPAEEEGPVTTTGELEEGEGEEEEEEEAEEKDRTWLWVLIAILIIIVFGYLVAKKKLKIFKLKQ